MRGTAKSRKARSLAGARLVDRLTPKGYDAVPERAILFEVKAWDENCPQHIPQRFEAAV